MTRKEFIDHYKARSEALRSELPFKRGEELKEIEKQQKALIYKAKVFIFLYDMKLDSSESIHLITTSETRDKFIATIKNFIDLGYDDKNKFMLDFDAYYIVLKKHDIDYSKPGYHVYKGPRD